MRKNNIKHYRSLSCSYYLWLLCVFLLLFVDQGTIEKNNLDIASAIFSRKKKSRFHLRNSTLASKKKKKKPKQTINIKYISTFNPFSKYAL